MLFNDPDYPEQAETTLGPDGVNLLPAQERYSGAGVRIGVVDTGITWDDPELVGQVDTAAGWSAVTDSPDAYAGPGDRVHGTLVALILGARANNGTGGIGAAWGATMISYEIAWRDDPSHEDQVAVLARQWQVDISSNSWGVLPYTDNFLGEGWREGEAIAFAATEGRDGLGTVIIRSAGNNAEEGDDLNARNYANNRFTITVGAVDVAGDVQPFSTHGAALWIAATADATSYAVPLVSGTVALMLEANPALGYRDVQAILALSARPAGDRTGPVVANDAAGFLDGGGFETSRGAGFGILDAAAAVRLAEIWQGPARTEANIEQAGAAGTGFLLPARGTATAQVSIAEDILVERAVLTLELEHPMITTLRVWLVSPAGTESLILDVMGGGLFPTPGGSRIAFQYTSTQFFWEASPGTWTLRVEDTAPADRGAVVSWRLDLYGAPNGTDDTYYYTDGFAEHAASDAARVALTDPDGGIDGLNAAAASTGSLIDLTPGGTASRIDGAPVGIAANTVIEQAWGGGGNDTILGNSQANLLGGSWGDDRIDGQGGADRIEGGEGADTLLGGDQADSLRGETGDDSLEGGNGDDALAGDEGADRLSGGLGLDTLVGGAGADAFVFDDRFAMTDSIADFTPGEDRIWIRTEGFGGLLAPGPLPPLRLATGGVANDASAMFIYDPATGVLLWDIDGSGPAGANRIALLETRPALQASDILLIP